MHNLRGINTVGDLDTEEVPIHPAGKGKKQGRREDHDLVERDQWPRKDFVKLLRLAVVHDATRTTAF